MLFMVIERFRNQDALAVYRRAAEKGRMMPEGLTYVESWVEANFNRCFQLVECEDAGLLQAWIVQWSDLVETEIVPVVHSHETSERLRPFLFPEESEPRGQ
jgi:hypothetical protein